MRRHTKRKVYKSVFGGFVILISAYLLLPSFKQRIEDASDVILRGVVNRTLNRFTSQSSQNRFLEPLQQVTGHESQTSPVRGVAAVLEYCNSPTKVKTGVEGQAIKDFKLRMVHVFTRHGDRASVYRLPGISPPDVSCKFSAWYTGSDTKIQDFPVIMDRMFEKRDKRSHFFKWALYPDKDECSSSMLTGKGALQHFQLGRHFRNVYIKDSLLFTTNMSVSKQILVKSTGTPRTYQSAVSFLYGYLPEYSVSDVNIEYSQSLQFCSMNLQSPRGCQCSNVQKLYSRAKQYILEINKNDTNTARSRKKIFATLNVDSSESLLHLADAVAPAFCHNVSQKCLSQRGTRCVTDDVMGTIWDMLTDQTLLHNFDPKQNMLKYSSIVMTPVLMEILHRLQKLTEGHLLPKFVLYSGHDVTLTPLLHVLGLHDGRWPPYASRVVIELLEFENSGQNTFYLKFLYNGFDKTSDVLFCRGKLFHGLCALNYFKDFVLTKILRRFGYKNYYDACSK